MNFDDYKHDVRCPFTSQFRTTYWYRAGQVVAKKVGDNNPEVYVEGIHETELANPKQNNLVKDAVVDEEAFQAARKVYGAAQAEVHRKFKEDLFKEFGVEDNPKRELLFDKAYERGHSAGMEEVYGVFSDLVELIQ
jgi:hypothetical protein